MQIRQFKLLCASKVGLKFELEKFKVSRKLALPTKGSILFCLKKRLVKVVFGHPNYNILEMIPTYNV